MINRGTGNFIIETSNEVDGPYQRTLTGKLTDVRGWACDDVPIQRYKVNPPAAFRYLKFTAVTKYHRGAGLQYFSMEPP